MAAATPGPKGGARHSAQWLPAIAPDTNFSSIMRLDATGGWHVLAVSQRGVLAADEAASRVLHFFFPEPTEWNGAWPVALASVFLKVRDWGATRSLRHTSEVLVYHKQGIRLTVRLVPADVDGHLILRTEVEPSAAPALPLTQREQEIAELVAVGRTNAEAGLVLNISARTVQKHLENIFRKLGVETRTALAIRVRSATAAPAR